MITSIFRDKNDRRWYADDSQDALVRVAAVGQPLLTVAVTHIVNYDLSVNADVLANHHRALFAMVAPQASERGVMLATFARVMHVNAVNGAWDAIIAGLKRRGLWPTTPVQKANHDERDVCGPRVFDFGGLEAEGYWIEFKNIKLKETK